MASSWTVILRPHRPQKIATTQRLARRGYNVDMAQVRAICEQQLSEANARAALPPPRLHKA
jgi:hypothetical protein